MEGDCDKDTLDLELKLGDGADCCRSESKFTGIDVTVVIRMMMGGIMSCVVSTPGLSWIKDCITSLFVSFLH